MCSDVSVWFSLLAYYSVVLTPLALVDWLLRGEHLRLLAPTDLYICMHRFFYMDDLFSSKFSRALEQPGKDEQLK
jgi:hypothetical protein